MSAVQLLFTRRRHPGSALIRVTTWSAWSHVDLIDGESVLGAVAFDDPSPERADAQIVAALRRALVVDQRPGDIEFEQRAVVGEAVAVEGGEVEFARQRAALR